MHIAMDLALFLAISKALPVNHLVFLSSMVSRQYSVFQRDHISNRIIPIRRDYNMMLMSYTMVTLVCLLFDSEYPEIDTHVNFILRESI